MYWVDFSPDGAFVVTAGTDGTARVWNVETGDSMVVLNGHSGTVAQAGFSPDGDSVVTAGSDKTARVWDAASGVQTAVLRGEVESADFSPDGRSVATAGEDGSARIYPCQLCNASLEHLLALAQERVTRQLTPEEREQYLSE